jgi:hypothetical protein
MHFVDSRFGEARMTRRKIARTGCAFLELLVTIAIIAVVIGLLLPAAQQVRESTARAKCMNNSKQLCLARINYGSANGVRSASFLAQGIRVRLLNNGSCQLVIDSLTAPRTHVSDVSFFLVLDVKLS